MKTTVLQCSHCGSSFEKELKEVTRQRKVKGEETPFFCNMTCHGLYRVIPPVTKVCPCGQQFETSSGSSHCSRSCTTIYTMTPDRLNAIIEANKKTRFVTGSLNTSDDGLRVREWDKYDTIHQMLSGLSIPHLFEYHIPGTHCVYDLALFDMWVLVEFDEPHHRKQKARDRDDEKDLVARQNGWSVFRIDTGGLVAPYPPRLLVPLLSYYD